MVVESGVNTRWCVVVAYLLQTKPIEWNDETEQNALPV